MIHYTPWDDFSSRLSPIRRGGGAVEASLSVCALPVVDKITQEIRLRGALEAPLSVCALPVVDKITLEIRLSGCVILCVT